MKTAPRSRLKDADVGHGTPARRDRLWTSYDIRNVLFIVRSEVNDRFVAVDTREQRFQFLNVKTRVQTAIVG